MSRLLIHGLRVCLAVTTLVAAGLVFRSEAQLRLESHYVRNARPLPHLTHTARLIDQRRIEHYGKYLAYSDPRQAAQTLQHALSAAPLDIHTWSRYSVTLFYAGDLAEANRASQHTLQLGARDAAVGMEQALLAADFWQAANVSTRKLWIKNIDHLMNKVPLRLAQYADSTDRATRLCNIAQPGSSLAALCARRE